MQPTLPADQNTAEDPDPKKLDEGESLDNKSNHIDAANRPEFTDIKQESQSSSHQDQAHVSASNSEENRDSELNLEGYHVYLSNIPENAKVANLFGAIRKQIGEFKSVNLVKIRNGVCKLSLKKRETRDRILDNPVNLFGVALKRSKENPCGKDNDNFFPLFANKGIGGITNQDRQLAAMLDRVWMNKQQQKPLDFTPTGSGSSGSGASNPWTPASGIPSALGQSGASLRDLLDTTRNSMLPGANAFDLLKQRSAAAGVGNTGSAELQLDELELENDKLRLEVRYLRERLEMYEKRLYGGRDLSQPFQRVW